MSKVLILSLSLIGRNISANQYIFENDISKVFEGVQTNEVAAKLSVSEYGVDRIICLLTKEVFEKKNEKLDDKTTYEYFKSRIETFCGSKIPKPTFVPVLMYNEDTKQKLGYAEIFRLVVDRIGESQEIFIDTTGGGRDGVVLIQLLVKYLENFEKKVTKAWYSELIRDDADNTHGTIKDVTDVYDVLSTMDAISVFTETGSVSRLKRLYESGAIKKKTINKAAKAMDSFSSSLMMSNTANVQQSISDMRKAFESINKMEASEFSSSEILLQMLIPKIQERMFPQPTDDILYLIRWCLDNRMIQQALTLFVERIPVYVFSKGFITYKDSKVQDINVQPGTTLEYQMFYTDMVTYTADAFTKKQAENEREKKLETILDGIPENDNMKAFRFLCEKAVKAKDDKDVSIIKQLIDYVGFGKNSKPRKKQNFIDYMKQLSTNSSVSESNTPKSSGNSLTNKLEAVDRRSSLNFNGYQLHITLPEYRELFAGYIYVKALRNQINHASDTENLDQRGKELIHKYCEEISGFYSEDMDSIINNVNIIIDFIMKLQITDRVKQ